MPDPFDDAKDALSGAEPTTDLWAEASRRAASGDVVELAPVSNPHHRGRWLAVAAAIALVAGTVGVLSQGDDSTVDTTPSGADDPEITIYQGEDGCSFGITGEPPAPREFGPAEDPVPGNHFVIGDLMARVNVPMWTEDTQLSYVYERVQLQRGEVGMRALDEQSTLVEGPPERDACENFSVIVAGGNPGVTEPAAIALADRIVLQSELPGDNTTTTSIFGSDGCFFGIGGDPLLLDEGPADPPLVDPAGQPEGQTIVHATLGEQVAEIHVPGMMLDDLIGERVEEVELERGTANVWFGADFVQVRWFPGGDAPCDSFTVTVAGSTEDGNRHAAVDLAERILLPADLGLEEPPTTDDDVATELEGDWQLESSTIDGKTTDGNGATFIFLDREANWSDGCNSFAGNYESTGRTTFQMNDTSSTELPCPTNPTSQAVQAVMSAETIEVVIDGDLLVLFSGDGLLTLHRAGTAGRGEDPVAATAGRETSVGEAASTLIGTSWVMADLKRDGETVPLLTEPLTVSFRAESIAWHDGCNAATSEVAYSDRGFVLVGNALYTQMACIDSGSGNRPTLEEIQTVSSFIHEFFASDVTVNVVIGSDGVGLDRSGDAIVLRPA